MANFPVTALDYCLIPTDADLRLLGPKVCMRLIFETEFGIWPEVNLWLSTPYFLSLKIYQFHKFELGVSA
jgi:hypothetical protein